MKKLLVIAGGTGGHIFPALVIAETLQKQGVLIEWLGTEVGMERQLIAGKFPLYFLPIKALRGKSIRTKLLSPLRLLRAIFLAYRLIKKINPDVVLGMGGYASGPGGIASWILKKPLIIHEQNAKAGLTNRLLSHFAKKILQAFPNAFPKNMTALTVGNPVRPSILAISRPHHYFQTQQKPWHILILGGSQGAQAMNQLLINFMAQYKESESFLLWHQTGQRDFETIQKKYKAFTASIYRVEPFIEKIEEAYAWADIVICRAGALTISELAAAGLPSILIPYPYAADDHQYANAQFLAQAGAAILFRESELSVEKLTLCLKDLLSAPNRLQVMSEKARICAQQNVVEKIIEEISRAGKSICA